MWKSDRGRKDTRMSKEIEEEEEMQHTESTKNGKQVTHIA
jgi:hypothetical protein